MALSHRIIGKIIGDRKSKNKTCKGRCIEGAYGSRPIPGNKECEECADKLQSRMSLKEDYRMDR